jgi:iron complex outermembrane receptor protein
MAIVKGAGRIVRRPTATLRALLSCGTMLALPLLPATAAAQQLEEIIVTAQKRTERLQEAPISVSAVTAEMLEQRGVVDTSNLGALAPNVTVNPTPGSSNTLGLFIRGIGDADAILTADAGVGVYVDGVVLGRIAGEIFDLVDLQRVEVLRGPQGTLYGRNTTGGAVNLITAKPSDTFGAEQKFSYGSFRAWSSRTRVDTGEIANTGISAKLSFVHKQQIGTVNNVLKPASLDPGSNRTNAARIALRFDQGGSFRANYSFDYSRARDVAPVFQLTALRPDVLAFYSSSALFGGSPFIPPLADSRRGSIVEDTAGPIYTTILGHTLNLEADVGALTLRSMTGFRVWNDNTTRNDLDGNGALAGLVLNLATFAVAPGQVSLFNANNDRHQHQISEEINVLGSLLDSRLEYVLGGFYFHERAKERNDQRYTFVRELVPGFNAGINLNTILWYSHYSTSKAVFGQGTFHITDQLDVTAGARYTADNKHLVQISPTPRDVRRKFSKPNWAASVNYKWQPSLMTYARVATGYKAGGINARASNEGYNPENITSYEAGLKSELFDRRLRFNAAIYYQTLKDLQINQFQAGSGGATSITVNAGKANAKGFEAELDAVVFEGFTVNGTVGYNHRKYKRYDVLDPTTNSIINIASTVHSNTGGADWTFNVGGQYDFPKFGYGQLTARLDYSWRSKVYYHPSLFATPLNEFIASKAHGLLDARLTLSEIKLGGLDTQIAGYIRNLTNEEYKLWGIDFGSLGFAGNTWGTPRTYGLELTAKF